MGEKLKEARLRLGFSEKEASDETRVPVAVLAAFEAEDFSRTGAFVYASGFLKRYCLFLGLDSAPFLEEFRGSLAERAKGTEEYRGKSSRFSFLKFRSPVFIVMGFTVLFLIGYLGVNLVSSYSSPRLSFFDGGGNQETTDRTHTFRGITHPESDLTMNGRVVYLNERGEFEERVLLAGGLNAFEFAAKNKFGKITKVVRYIFVK